MTINPILPLLRLLQLASPSLPVGAYSYSQGLEWAVEDGLVTDEITVQRWISASLRQATAKLDGPILVRMHEGWQAGNLKSVRYWNDFILACRETRELQAEDQHLGMALGKVLEGLEIDWTRRWGMAECSFAAPYSLAAVEWRLSIDMMLSGYLWGRLENQVLTAMKLMPLGQRAGQRMLFELAKPIPAYIEKIVRLQDHEIGGSLPLLAIASSRHETQYSRLFRS
ncbi:Urease accessory protein UreF [Candidatus Methylobacter favarea]|uniref:Urease accessory protein UreF n=1 Tax=Candidatus Methylobacter favarea TaxID=2707345 RepID=A0A8S0WHZ4_9GAMM|nr:urease accessory UreF family protein [Candidatus Methylobacter favarea]CAA9890191.1 Urease accessory protein UreF [Candidatus Methylobacter favarea]